MLEAYGTALTAWAAVPAPREQRTDHRRPVTDLSALSPRWACRSIVACTAAFVRNPRRGVRVDVAALDRSPADRRDPALHPSRRVAPSAALACDDRRGDRRERS